MGFLCLLPGGSRKLCQDQLKHTKCAIIHVTHDVHNVAFDDLNFIGTKACLTQQCRIITFRLERQKYKI